MSRIHFRSVLLPRVPNLVTATVYMSTRPKKGCCNSASCSSGSQIPWKPRSQRTRSPTVHGSAGGAHLDWLVAVGGEVLGGNANDESAPEANSDTEEHVPVLDDAVRLVSEDASELGGQRIVADGKHHLPDMHATLQRFSSPSEFHTSDEHVSTQTLCCTTAGRIDTEL